MREVIFEGQQKVWSEEFNYVPDYSARQSCVFGMHPLQLSKEVPIERGLAFRLKTLTELTSSCCAGSQNNEAPPR